MGFKNMPTISPLYSDQSMTAADKASEERRYRELQELYQRMQQNQMANNYSSLLNQPMGQYAPVPTTKDMRESQEGRKAMLRMRVSGSVNGNLPVSFLEMYRTGDTVFVFIVANGAAIILEDNAGLFPSDTLISQLRLLEK
jgi:hypothetical protein